MKNEAHTLFPVKLSPHLKFDFYYCCNDKNHNSNESQIKQ